MIISKSGENLGDFVKTIKLDKYIFERATLRNSGNILLQKELTRRIQIVFVSINNAIELEQTHQIDIPLPDSLFKIPKTNTPNIDSHLR